MHIVLTVTWGPDQVADPKPVTIRCTWFARLACALTGHGLFVLGRTIRTKEPDVLLNLDFHAPMIRHELTHVAQQAREGVLSFLWSYWFRGKAAAYEAEARAAQDAFWPQWR